MIKRFQYTVLLMIVALIVSGCSNDVKEAIAVDKSLDKETIEKVEEKSILEELPEISHGLGYIDGHYVTNTIEALKFNYERGFRVFEVDLNMTSDNRLIARHDWTAGHYQWLGQDYQPIEEEAPIPFDDVMALKIHGKYNAPSWEQLLELMQEYPDIYLITDTKQKDEENVRRTFSYLVEKAVEVDPDLLQRIVPQIYDQPMLSYIESYHDFKEVIYTLYQHTNDDIPTAEELAEWSDQNDITAIAGLPFRLTEEVQVALNNKNIAIYTHTINDPLEAFAFREKGIGVYTDYLLYNGVEFIAP
jgi:glycerophosphoryl diester phosphodiesterase